MALLRCAALLNLRLYAQRETYGAQPPIELLRQWFDNGGWYDRAALTFRQVIIYTLLCMCIYTTLYCTPAT
jgi:hypothetical protein